MAIYDDLRNQTAYQVAEGQAPNPVIPDQHIKGEPPYQVGRQSILQRIQDTLGRNRIAGIIGALTTPAGPVRNYQREGLSPFQAGLAGYHGGMQSYEANQRKIAADAAAADLAQREIAAKEAQASAAQQRAGHYGRYVTNRALTKPTSRLTLGERINQYMQLTPEQLAAGKESGIIRTPRQQQQDNEDMEVKALIDRFPTMTEGEARRVVRFKPQVISTGQSYDIGRFRKDKVLDIRNKREFGVSQDIRRILARHNATPEDVYGLSAESPFATTGGAPQQQGDVLSMDEAKIMGILKAAEEGSMSLDIEQIEWLEDRLNELEAQDE